MLELAGVWVSATQVSPVTHSPGVVHTPPVATDPVQAAAWQVPLQLNWPVGQQTLPAVPVPVFAVQLVPLAQLAPVVQAPPPATPVQVPALQLVPDGQTTPQPPQLNAFVCVFTQAPLQLVVFVPVIGQQTPVAVVLPGPGLAQVSVPPQLLVVLQAPPVATPPTHTPLVQPTPQQRPPQTTWNGGHWQMPP